MSEHNGMHLFDLPFTRPQLNRAGLWLFFVSEGFMFAGILASRFSLWGAHRPELDQTLGLIVTSVLLLSSLTMYLGETAVEHGDNKLGALGVGLTFLLGLGFLVGVVFVEWPQAAAHGLSPSADQFGAIFFFMTGMHAFHVFSGLIYLAFVFFNIRKGYYTTESHWGVEAAALYWHFVDVVWVFFYPALYLIGTIAEH